MTAENQLNAVRVVDVGPPLRWRVTEYVTRGTSTELRATDTMLIGHDMVRDVIADILATLTMKLATAAQTAAIWAHPAQEDEIQ